MTKRVKWPARLWLESSPSKPNLISYGSGFAPVRAAKALRWIVLSLALVFQATPSLALDPQLSLHQYYCETWGRHDGFPASQVADITQTADGYIWFATQEGLVRFDGASFQLLSVTNFPIARQKSVRWLAPHPEGGLWFGLDYGGMGFYNSNEFHFDGIVDDIGQILRIRSGEILGLAGRKLVRFKGASAETLTDFESNLSGIAEDSGGKIWLGTISSGLFVWDGRKKPVEIEELRQCILTGLLIDREGNLWIGSNLGLYCLRPDRTLRSFGNGPRPVYDQITQLFMDRAGVIWFATKDAGLVQFKNGKFDTLKKEDGLADNAVNRLFEDREGSLWVATRNGFSQLIDQKLPVFSKADGLKEDLVRSIQRAPQGGFYATSEGALHYFDGTKFHRYGEKEGLADAWVETVRPLRGGQLVCEVYPQGLRIVQPGQGAITHSLHEKLTFVAEDRQGLLLGDGPRFMRWEQDRLVPYPFKNADYASFGWPSAVVSLPDGTMWFGFTDGLRQVKDGVSATYRTTEGLVNDDVLSLTADGDGTLWIATQGGISRFKEGKFQNCTSANGLYADAVRAIIPDDQGGIWMNSPRGIFSASRKCFEEFASGARAKVVCSVYTGADVVKSTEKGLGQRDEGCKTADGRIWFLTAKGIVMIDPAHLRTNTIPPPVYITEAAVNSIKVTDKTHPPVRSGKGELVFRFTALSYLAPDKISFRYQLVGYDTEWIEVRGRREAFYTNLKPGPYRFCVSACNADGVWSNTGASFDVFIPPHFYQTTLFMVLCGVGLAGIGFGFYQWKIWHLRWKQQKLQVAHDLLEAKVKDRTVELAKANDSLCAEVEEHQRTEAKLQEKTGLLEREIVERKKIEADLVDKKTKLEVEIEERLRAQQEVEQIHKELLGVSRRAGMAEVATSVVHNIGNVLNSVNVSATLVAERLQRSNAASVAKVAALLNEHAADLGRFMTQNEKGQKLPGYLALLAESIASEQEAVQQEMRLLRDNIEHIKGIVAMQQDYTRVSGVVETVPVRELVEDALKMHAGANARDTVPLHREYAEVPPITTDKHKVLQILVNLFQNANYACEESGRSDKQVTVRIANGGEDRVKIVVADNGIGIPAENLTKIFMHGFTTRQGGHGFGLHGGANAAKELGGSLTVRSDGPGCGTAFALELPLALTRPGSSSD
jgi:ligand-binding sensor domain-containing protein/signal transduction histidine kinase